MENTWHFLLLTLRHGKNAKYTFKLTAINLAGIESK